MKSDEIALFWRFIVESEDKLVESLHGFEEDDLNWSPLGNANSLYVLATHTMGNIEQNVLGGICDEPFQRDRDAEFLAKGASWETIQGRWRELRCRISECIKDVPQNRLERKKESSLGILTGRETLMVVARHAAEHLGHAEITHDLLKQKP